MTSIRLSALFPEKDEVKAVFLSDREENSTGEFSRSSLAEVLQGVLGALGFGRGWWCSGGP